MIIPFFFRLGRYPVHFHRMGDASASFVRGVSIWEAFNRAVNLHDTFYLYVEHVVAYRIKGGAFFLEDGCERHNIIRHNLFVMTMQSNRYGKLYDAHHEKKDLTVFVVVIPKEGWAVWGPANPSLCIIPTVKYYCLHRLYSVVGVILKEGLMGPQQQRQRSVSYFNISYFMYIVMFGVFSTRKFELKATCG